jgi:hypothetical protein
LVKQYRKSKFLDAFRKYSPSLHKKDLTQDEVREKRLKAFTAMIELKKDKKLERQVSLLKDSVLAAKYYENQLEEFKSEGLEVREELSAYWPAKKELLAEAEEYLKIYHDTDVKEMEGFTAEELVCVKKNAENAKSMIPSSFEELEKVLTEYLNLFYASDSD